MKKARKVAPTGVPRLTNQQHDNLMYSGVGQYLDRLIREDVARGGDVVFPGRVGNVVQSIWAAFHTIHKKDA